jgi:type I restriction enzyme S subunit
MKSFEMSDTSEHLSLTAAKVGSRVMPAETVFIVVRGMILAHSFPVVLASKPMAFNQDVKAVTAGQRLSGRFLAHWFVANSGYFLRKVTEATHGTKKLDMENLVATPIGLPPLTEQIAIIEREAAIDRQCKDESSYLLQLLALKVGLNDDLLTGRVRVTSFLTQ